MIITAISQQTIVMYPPIAWFERLIMIITAIGQQTIVMYPPIAWFVGPNYVYHCNWSADYRDVSSDSMVCGA